MRLSHVYIRNFRRIGSEALSLRFDPEKRMTLFLGDNACGKTSVLAAIEKVLTGKGPAPYDRHVDLEGRRAGSVEISVSVVPAEASVRRGLTYVYPRMDDVAEAAAPDCFFASYSAGFKAMDLRGLDRKEWEAADLAVRRFFRGRYSLLPPGGEGEVAENSGICLDRNLPARYLSGGLHRLIGIVSDLAARLSSKSNGAEEALAGEGIVTVDELDLHLHPGMQREVAGRFMEVFPRLHFVATTHSPLTVLGAARDAEIIRLDDAGRWADNVRASSGLPFSDAGLVLLSDLFGLPNLRAPEWDAPLARRDLLLAKGSLSADERRELEELDNRLRCLESAASPRELKTDILIDAIASRLGIKL